MEPTDFEYGERQYTAEDLAGHQWTFSETLEDVHPETWGGVLVSPAESGPSRSQAEEGARRQRHRAPALAELWTIPWAGSGQPATASSTGAAAAPVGTVMIVSRMRPAIW